MKGQFRQKKRKKDDDSVPNTDYKIYNDNAKGQMLIWNKDTDLPPNAKLKEVQKKVEHLERTHKKIPQPILYIS